MTQKYIPAHRATPQRRRRPRRDAPRRRAERSTRGRNVLVGAGAAGLAVVLLVPTDAAVGKLLDVGDGSPSSPTPRPAAHGLTRADLVAREASASRSRVDRTPVADPVKAAALGGDPGPATTRIERRSAPLTHPEPDAVADPVAGSSARVSAGSARSLAQALMPAYGLDSSEFSCLDHIWTQESGWNVYADNPSSSAYGIPQALPGSKMASAGPDWQSSAETQIRWGLGYIKDRYGSACEAWSFKQSHGWY